MPIQDRTELLRRLIAAGAKINTNEKYQPLYDVIVRLREDKEESKRDVLPLVCLLIQHGAEMNFRVNGLCGVMAPREPLVIAAIKSVDSLVLQTILNAGVKVDNPERCPFHACFEPPGKICNEFFYRRNKE